MINELTAIKKQITELKVLLDMSYYCNDAENKRKLLDEFDTLSYRYYKAAIKEMRSMEGNGDGI